MMPLMVYWQRSRPREGKRQGSRQHELIQGSGKEKNNKNIKIEQNNIQAVCSSVSRMNAFFDNIKWRLNL